VQDIQLQIGKTIRALRQKRKLTQDVFAEWSGLHRAHVGEIERGESNVTIQTLKTTRRHAASENRRFGGRTLRNRAHPFFLAGV
jgi:transcriptional regulator with XRE-family HTH domain